MIDLNQSQPIAINSAATTNATLINAGRTGLSTLICSNIGGAAAFVKLYDKASAPTVGTDVPKLTIPIPAGGIVPIDISDCVLLFVLGLGLAITNLAADTDTTAVAAAQVKVFGTYIN
jgi:hypothetical protein